MPHSHGGSPIPEIALPEPEPEFVRDASGVEIARRGRLSPTAYRIKQGPLSYGTVVHFGDGLRTSSRARTYRAPDLMVTMLANSTISLDQAQAGRAFRADFHAAGYIGIQALDPGKIPGTRGPGDLSEAAIDARARIVDDLDALGGFNGPLARAAWFVLGFGLSIREWARRERFGRGISLSEATARRRLYDALTVLSEVEIDRRR